MKYLIFIFFCLPIGLYAQKKPLDHSVYDGWQSIGERAISNNGKFVVYTVTPQEGDGMLVIQATDNSIKKKRPDDMPKDSLAIVEPGKDSIVKIARVRTYKTPQKGDGRWLAYLSE